MEAGVDVAGAGAHHEPLQRGEAHGRLDGFTAEHRRDGGSVAEVADDELEVRVVDPAQVLRGLLRHVAVRRAVEAVLPDAVLLGQFLIHRVGVGLGGEGGEEGGVEDAHVRDAGEQVHGGPDAGDGRGVVQRSELGEAPELGDDVRVDPHRLAELVPTVHDAVADGDHVVQAGAELLEGGDHGAERDGVVGVPALADRLLVAVPVLELARGLADALHQARRAGLMGLRVDHLVLHGRRPAVEQEDRLGHDALS